MSSFLNLDCFCEEKKLAPPIPISAVIRFLKKVDKTTCSDITEGGLNSLKVHSSYKHGLDLVSKRFLGISPSTFH